MIISPKITASCGKYVLAASAFFTFAWPVASHGQPAPMNQPLPSPVPPPAGAPNQPTPPTGLDVASKLSMSPVERQAFLDARIAGIHAGLQLTTQQEPLWPQAEKAARAFFAQRQARREAHKAEMEKWRAEHMFKGAPKGPPADLMDRLRQRADHKIEDAQALKALVDGAAPLYNALTPEQRARLPHLMRHMRDMGPMRDMSHMRDMDAMHEMGTMRDTGSQYSGASNKSVEGRDMGWRRNGWDRNPPSANFMDPYGEDD